MPPSSDADTINILIATDNHVGYNERDAIRGMDSHKTFREIMNMAKERDVDMVLLAGDLFHDNKPSRKSMCSVMEALRTNCLGDKPCELEMLSDGSEHFPTSFNHVNYEDQDINVAIPVFSIHGNHDDPTGEGNYSALDMLHMSGLLNYYGKASQADKIDIKPILLQKGHTKLALYGMSNMRDERLFRTFQSKNVTFFQPGVQTGDWFNLMSVHQNHHAHTETSYLPENWLPTFMDLIVWGHEHECLIEPRWNSEQSFHVMQPGSSVATSLMPGEAVPKKVCLLKVTGKEFKCEPILLKTVRPFIMKEIVLAEEPALKNLWKKSNNRTELTRHLMDIVNKLIEEAQQTWLEAQEEGFSGKVPLPLVRLRVEYSAPDGGHFDCENPQRFSNRFTDRVANQSDVVAFYRKKVNKGRKANDNLDMPDEAILEDLAHGPIKVEKYVQEFLSAQSLSILPQKLFGQAVAEFVNKDDKHSVTVFLDEQLAVGMKDMAVRQADAEDSDDEEILAAVKSHLEQLAEKDKDKTGKKRKSGKPRLKPQPDHWDEEMDGAWEEDPGAYEMASGPSDVDDNASEAVSMVSTSARGRGRGRGGRTTAPSTRKPAAAAKKAAPARATRGKKKVIEEEEDEDDSDIPMVLNDNDDEEDSDDLIFSRAPPKSAAKPAPKKPAAKAPAARKAAPVRKPAASKQSTLNFTQPSQRAPPSSGRANKPIELSDDEISDDDAFDPPPTAKSRPRR